MRVRVTVRATYPYPLYPYPYTVQILVSPGVSLSEGEPSEIAAPQVHTEPLLISCRYIYPRFHLDLP